MEINCKEEDGMVLQLPFEFCCWEGTAKGIYPATRLADQSWLLPLINLHTMTSIAALTMVLTMMFDFYICLFILSLPILFLVVVTYLSLRSSIILPLVFQSIIYCNLSNFAVILHFWLACSFPFQPSVFYSTQLVPLISIRLLS